MVVGILTLQLRSHLESQVLSKESRVFFFHLESQVLLKESQVFLFFLPIGI